MIFSLMQAAGRGLVKHKTRSLLVALVLTGCSGSDLDRAKSGISDFVKDLKNVSVNQPRGLDTRVVCGRSFGTDDIVQQTLNTREGASLRSTSFLGVGGATKIYTYTDHDKRTVERGDYQKGIQAIEVRQAPDYALSIRIDGIRTQDDNEMFEDGNRRLSAAWDLAGKVCDDQHLPYNRDAIALSHLQWDGDVRVSRVAIQVDRWRFEVTPGYLHGVSLDGEVADARGNFAQYSLFNSGVAGITYQAPGQVDTYYPLDGQLIERSPGRTQSSRAGQPTPGIAAALKAAREAIRASLPVWQGPLNRLSLFPNPDVPPPPTP